MICMFKAIHYCKLMYQKTFETCALKYKSLIQLFFSTPGLACQAALKNTKVKLDLLTDIDMLLMLEKGIRGGICHSIYGYVKCNNKYMKEYGENKESSYFNIGM